jgi:hypothetical protein
VREDCAAVEGAVVLGVVEPALEVVRIDAAEADADDVAGGVGQSVGKVVSANPAEGEVEGQRAEELVVSETGPVSEADRLVGRINGRYLRDGGRESGTEDRIPYRGIESDLLLGKERRHLLPDGSGAALLWEAENGIGAPAALDAIPAAGTITDRGGGGETERDGHLITFSTTLATLAVATLSPSQEHCMS